MRCPPPTPRSHALVLAADLALLGDLDAQVDQATDQLARLLPLTPFAPLLTVPGWAAVRAGNYGGALGDPARFDHHRQVYRTAGLNPIQYESAGKRRDSVISREGSVELRRALIDLGVGLWLNDPAAKVYGSHFVPAGRRAWSSAAPWHTAPTASPSRSSATRAATTPAGGPERTDLTPFTTPVGNVRLEGKKDPDQTPLRLWQTPQDVMPLLAWRPGPSPFGSPNEAR